MSDTIFNEVASSIRQVRRDNSLTIAPGTEITSLGVDSLDFVELLFSLEEKFDIEIPFNANEGGGFPFATVGSAADAIEDIIAKKHKPA
ncbi:phosphopantetheine-binding protein [Novosphingopyxis sp.]|uniref:phosphopantetheine-binding protein n=1 Tax=Novosphingopyxis sp. TaxID=2709690 RepID=UPI003B5B4D4C